MVKTEPDLDAPIPLAGSKTVVAKPKIIRKANNTYVVQYPDGREKPIPADRVPQKIKDAAEAREKKARAEHATNKAQQAKRKKISIRNDDGPKRRKKVKVAKTEAGDDSDAPDDAEAKRKMANMRANRSYKDQMISEFLCRWWFVWPDYPPVNFDYTTALDQAKLREVNVERWEDEPKMERGYMKCYQLSTFPGMFRCADQKLHDLRPEKDKPSYNYLAAKPDREIGQLLIQAYKNQLAELKKSPYIDLMIDDRNGPGWIQKQLNRHQARHGQ